MTKRKIEDENLKLRDYLAKRFKGWKSENRGFYEEKKRQDQPVIDAISGLGKEIKSVTEQNKNLINELVPLAAKSYAVPTPISSIPSTPFELKDAPARRRAIGSTSSDKIELGPLARDYLSTGKFDKDEVFGLYPSMETSEGGGVVWKIGKSKVTFEGNDIKVNLGDKDSWNRYPGTVGLWELVAKKQPKDYTDEDYQSYKEILIMTDALYQNNDASQNRVKSSSGEKYRNLIKPIWNQVKTGSGVKRYNTLPKEFVWVDDVRKLVDRLLVIAGEENAGNRNFYNEKVGIVDMISTKLSNFIVNDDKGIGYLIKIINTLPPKFWNVAEGKGLVNDIINKLPFEMHLPGYQYCGPGTKLEKKLERGDKGVNPLDAACKNHDIAYNTTQTDLDARHEADRKLEHAAFERFVSRDASLGERVAALGTTIAMNTKQKLGWGI